jgi:hypothetical protein
MALNLTKDEKNALGAMLKSGLMLKVIELALAEMGDDLDSANTLSTERAANAYFMEAGARGLLRKIFEAADVRERVVIAPKKLRHVTQ